MENDTEEIEEQDEHLRRLESTAIHRLVWCPIEDTIEWMKILFVGQSYQFDMFAKEIKFLFDIGKKMNHSHDERRRNTFQIRTLQCPQSNEYKQIILLRDFFIDYAWYYILIELHNCFNILLLSCGDGCYRTLAITLQFIVCPMSFIFETIQWNWFTICEKTISNTFC